jgi:molybdate transport system substrate-binding protein
MHANDESPIRAELPGAIYSGILPSWSGVGLRKESSMRTLITAAALVLGLLAGTVATVRAATVTVFAAASLKEALDAQARAFESRSGDKVVVSYAGSNALARQIESGAPADVFISADLEWMDYLQTRGLLAPRGRVELLRNRLVLIAPSDSRVALTPDAGFPLAAALGPGRLALANPDSVPAGKYAKAALETLGVWATVEAKVARTENVRAALVLVARGEAPLGIVYATDAAAEPKVRVVATFPENTHPPIVYPGAIVAGDRSTAADALIAFLASASARPIWERFGFTVIGKPLP